MRSNTSGKVEYPSTSQVLHESSIACGSFIFSFLISHLSFLAFFFFFCLGFTMDDVISRESLLQASKVSYSVEHYASWPCILHVHF